MKFEPIKEGFVSRREPNTPTAVSAGSRCVLVPSGDLVCTYIVQSALGINDFVAVLARSSDGGESWREQGAIWPHLTDRYSIFCSISRSPAGELFLYGISTPIDHPGETFWSEATQGLKQNELVWAKSTDEGKTWTDPQPIPMPIPGSAEAPGPMCITRSGRWIACYAPYNTFDQNVVVQRDQIVAVFSDDQGRSWRHTSLLQFKEPGSGGAEAWVIQLADDRLLGTSWHMNHHDGSDFPNAYALSEDNGATWRPTRSTGILGQSTALAPLPDGRALFLYNQRKHGDIGVWLAVVHPTESDFGVQANQIVWQAEKPAQKEGSVGHSEWENFAFGEPSVTVLPDHTLLVTLWCVQPSGQGVRYVKLRTVE